MRIKDLSSGCMWKCNCWLKISRSLELKDYGGANGLEIINGLVNFLLKITTDILFLRDGMVGMGCVNSFVRFGYGMGRVGSYYNYFLLSVVSRYGEVGRVILGMGWVIAGSKNRWRKDTICSCLKNDNMPSSYEGFYFCRTGADECVSMKQSILFWRIEGLRWMNIRFIFFVNLDRDWNMGNLVSWAKVCSMWLKNSMLEIWHVNWKKKESWLIIRRLDLRRYEAKNFFWAYRLVLNCDENRLLIMGQFLKQEAYLLMVFLGLRWFEDNMDNWACFVGFFKENDRMGIFAWWTTNSTRIWARFFRSFLVDQLQIKRVDLFFDFLPSIIFTYPLWIRDFYFMSWLIRIGILWKLDFFGLGVCPDQIQSS
ncbi:hypothetical protein R6Q59_002968 [Mikania micrantha]